MQFQRGLCHVMPTFSGLAVQIQEKQRRMHVGFTSAAEKGCHSSLLPCSGGPPPVPEPLQGASDAVVQAVHANEAAMREVLQLSRVSMASSGTGSNGEPDVDMEYQCPICLVGTLLDTL